MREFYKLSSSVQSLLLIYFIYSTHMKNLNLIICNKLKALYTGAKGGVTAF